jgi:tRNA G10  N-methylase Trm11
MIKVNTPKLYATSNSSNKSIYKYYAGFSKSFVQDVISNIKKDALILDPWNGGGTTTEIASLLGHRSIGFDINPAMVMIAKAKLIGFGIKGSIKSLGKEIADKSKQCSDVFFSEDPLQEWLYPNSAALIRQIEMATQYILSDSKSFEMISHKQTLDEISDLCAFFYTALFRTVKKLLFCFKSTNPTWIKSPDSVFKRIKPSRNLVLYTYQNEIQKMENCLTREHNNFSDHFDKNKNCRIEVASSKSIPIESNSIDAIVTSPPYCTRIDYAVATKSELAVLGYSTKNGLRSLRKSMIGTPTINNLSLKEKKEWGPTCLKLLGEIRKHPSKASCTYYLKTHLQYFNDIFHSINELNRCLKKNGDCVVVVQGSFYKNIQNNLPKIFAEMSESFDWKLSQKFDFCQTKNIAELNPLYRNIHPNVSPTESVLWFQK